MSKDMGFRGLQMLATTVINILTTPNATKIRTLKALPNVLTEHFMRNVIDGWVYLEENGVFLPYLVGTIEYIAELKNSHTDRPASVRLDLHANTASKGNQGNPVGKRSLYFSSESIVGATLPQLLQAYSLHIETPELKAEYEGNLQLFHEYQPQQSKQFLLSGTLYNGDDLDRMGKAHKMGDDTVFRAINEETLVKRIFISEIINAYWEERCPGSFTALPYHPIIYFFNLETHSYQWAHVSNVKPYVYKPELREKLILPEDHKTLIDILTSDLDMLADIVAGKGGGTCILASGGPGLGKTLTAEVYSEVVGRPLYRIHSGQLGIESSAVEKNLKTILMRAQRWNAVTLLDEADVFIRQRGDDLDHNAVVAAFLRNLEYFDGLLFMTTNRENDVDDAIVSRCIAHIRYTAPDAPTRKKLWEVLGENYKADLSDDLISQLTDKFPSVGGRDIKELLKLTLKFAKGRQLPVDLDLFVKCGQFRGL